jgi:NDP-sugar pyrophosphorylase family protein
MEKVFNHQIVVLAGGLATRLGELSKNQPKSLIRINHNPFYNISLNFLKRMAYTGSALPGYLGEQIESYFGTGNRFGMDISIVLRTNPSLPPVLLKTPLRFLMMNSSRYTAIPMSF